MPTTVCTYVMEMSGTQRSTLHLDTINIWSCLLASSRLQRSCKTWLMTSWETWSINLSLCTWMTYWSSLVYRQNAPIMSVQSSSVSCKTISMWDQRQEISLFPWINKKQMQMLRFLGWANFYSRFIKNYTSVASPLHHLMTVKVQLDPRGWPSIHPPERFSSTPDTPGCFQVVCGWG